MLLQNNIAPAIIAQANRRYYIMYLNQAQVHDDYRRLEDFICDCILDGYALLQDCESPQARRHKLLAEIEHNAGVAIKIKNSARKIREDRER